MGDFSGGMFVGFCITLVICIILFIPYVGVDMTIDNMPTLNSSDTSYVYIKQYRYMDQPITEVTIIQDSDTSQFAVSDFEDIRKYTK